MYIIIVLSILIVFFYSKYLVSFCIKKALQKHTIPYLKNKGKFYERIEKIPFQLTPFKKKGDFEKENVANPFHDTNFNRKIYCYLYYRDDKGMIYKTTMKIWTNCFTFPIKVEYFPKINVHVPDELMD